MKALIHTKPFTFEMQDVPVPEIAEDEVLIKVKATGICGSDVHGMSGQTGRRIPPIIMGHESAGVIERIGSRVTRFAKGDRVTFDSTIYCGKCEYCTSGRVNLCSDRKVLGVSCDEYRRHGTMADWVAVPEHIIYRLPDNVSFEQGAMIEPLSIAMHAVRRANIDLNQTVAVFGCGIIGLLTLQCARIAGGGKIIALDTREDRMQMAKRLGADELVNPAKGDPVQAIRDLTGGRGADVVFDAVGIEQTVNTGLNATRKGGRIVLVGNLAPTVTFGLQYAVTREIDVLGSCASNGEYPTCIDLIASGRIDIDPLISKVVPLNEGADWFHRLHDAKETLFKVILKPEMGN